MAKKRLTKRDKQDIIDVLAYFKIKLLEKNEDCRNFDKPAHERLRDEGAYRAYLTAFRQFRGLLLRIEVIKPGEYGLEQDTNLDSDVAGAGNTPV
jgi:hypothetical protein